MRRRTRQSARGRKAAYREAREEEVWRDYVPEPERVPETVAAPPHETPAEEVPPTAPGVAEDYIPPYSLPRRRRRPFYAALAVSAALHLSSVTLFSVVVYFPRQDLRYFEFSLVQTSVAPIAAAAASTGGDRLQLGRIADGFAAMPADDIGLSALQPPAIELPTLEFAELSRLRIRQESAADLSRYDELVRPSARDPWQLIEAGVGRVRDTLADWNLPLGIDPPEAPPAAPVRIHPAPGFEGRIDWGAGAPARPLLFAPPMTVLTRVDPKRFEDPLEVVFQVNAEGRVTNVWSPSLESAELLDRIQLAMLRYRFEPLAPGINADQTGTLYIGPDQDRP